MKLNTACLGNHLIWLLTVALVSSFYFFSTNVLSRYLFAGLCIAILLLSAALCGGKLRFGFRRFHLFILAFALYTLVTTLWEWRSGAAFSKFRTLLEILLCYSMLYIHYEQKPDVEELLNAVKWAGYIVALYSIFFYGLDRIILAGSAANLRLENAYDNVNSIGQLCAFACVIQIYQIIYGRFSWALLFAAPAVVLLAATQSRKALVALFGGLFLILACKNFSNHRFFVGFFRTLLLVVVGIGLILLLSRMDLFAGIFERFNRMIDSLTGSGQTDHSALLRQTMRHVGWQQFLKTPLFGIGIGSSGALLYAQTGKDTYLHCNYVELLASGGIIAFLLYYSAYFSIGKAFLIDRRFTRKSCSICMVMLLVLLILDYGRVAYYSKITYFYFMIFFLQADKTRMSASQEG